MKATITAATVAACLLFSGMAMAAGADYVPAPGVTIGGNAGGAPGGIHPDCAKKTTRADMVDCIKEKAREQGKADVMQGKTRK